MVEPINYIQFNEDQDEKFAQFGQCKSSIGTHKTHAPINGIVLDENQHKNNTLN